MFVQGIYWHGRMYLPNLSAMDWMWHKVNFLKQNLASLNSEFSLSLTACWIKAQEPSLPHCWGLGEEMDSCFSRGISIKWNTDSLIKDWNLSWSFHFLIIMLSMSSSMEEDHKYFCLQVILNESKGQRTKLNWVFIFWMYRFSSLNDWIN